MPGVVGGRPLNRTLGLLIVLLSLLCSGCVTPKIVDAIGAVDTHERIEVVETHFETLERAVRSVDGTYYLEASYSDGSSRIFVCDPVPGVLEPRPLRPHGSQSLPGGVEVELCSPACMHDEAAVCVRVDDGTLEIREGNPQFQALGTFPAYVTRVRTSDWGRAALTKLAYLAILPVAVVADAALGAAYGLFCTEAGWQLIFAVLLCWAH